MVVAQNERSERKRAADLIWSDHFQHLHHLFWGQRPNLLCILTEYIFYGLSTHNDLKEVGKKSYFVRSRPKSQMVQLQPMVKVSITLQAGHLRWIFHGPNPWKSNLSTGNTQHFIAVGIWDIWSLHQIPQQLCEPRRGAGAWDGFFFEFWIGAFASQKPKPNDKSLWNPKMATLIFLLQTYRHLSTQICCIGYIGSIGRYRICRKQARVHMRTPKRISFIFGILLHDFPLQHLEIWQQRDLRVDFSLLLVVALGPPFRRPLQQLPSHFRQGFQGFVMIVGETISLFLNFCPKIQSMSKSFRR